LQQAVRHIFYIRNPAFRLLAPLVHFLVVFVTAVHQDHPRIIAQIRHLLDHQIKLIVAPKGLGLIT
jgi:hypothetical protein